MPANTTDGTNAVVIAKTKKMEISIHWKILGKRRKERKTEKDVCGKCKQLQLKSQRTSTSLFRLKKGLDSHDIQCLLQARYL